MGSSHHHHHHMEAVVDTTSETAKPPQRLLATVVDSLALECPTRRFCLIPNGKDVHQGFREVTFRDLCCAVNRMSWWMEKHLASSVKGATIAYLGSNDIRYIILMLASHKTGCTIFFPSTRLSNEAYDSVFGATQTKMLLFSPEKHPLVSGLTGPSKAISSLEVPSVPEMLNDNPDVKNYPFTSTFEEFEDKTAFIIHSSGTTGMPKPVSLTHGYLGTVDYSAFMPRPAGRSPSFFQDLLSADPHPRDPVLSVTPYFHIMGLVSFFVSIFHNIPFVTISDQPLSVSLLVDIIRATHPTATILPPSILEDMSLSQEALECLGTLKFVCYGGAPLAKQVGDKVSQYTQLRNAIGSTEIGIIGSLVPEGKENWGYFEWNPAYGIDMQPVADDVYELVIPRLEDSRRMHGIFHTFPSFKEYRSKDLYVRHPKIPKLWQYRGRLDDVIVLSNGEKLNPVTLEKVVEGHPFVRRALVFGQGRFQTGLLIEPAMDDRAGKIDERNFVDMIWPLVQTANQNVPRYGQVLKNMIRLASPAKPFKLTPKGTTQRHAVNADYAEEIDAMYATHEKQLGPKLPSTIDSESVHCYVHEVITSLTGRSDIRPSDDLFGLGLDSLQATQLSNILRSAVLSYNPALSTENITVQNIYTRPTTDKLAGLLLGVLQEQKEQAAIAPTESRSERIAGLVSKYTADLPARYVNSPTQLPRLSTVILTGSTGSLGTYILSGLLNDPHVAKVYCFNRAADAATRQRQGFAEKGLDASLLEDPSKVEFLHVSFGDKHFGLDDSMYSKLLDTVDLIVHNAWKVNFNHPVSSFEDPHIKGVREFVNFSLEARYNTHLAFVSSVSTIAGWTPSSDESAVPELPMDTVDAVLKQGYGESKHVGERICLEASRTSGVPTSVLRVGQIAGPDSRLGLWNPHEWLPSVVKTSKSMGKVPDTLGSVLVDWIAVDTLAKITIEILLSRRSSLSTQRHAVFHLTNPSQIPWASLIPAIQERYPMSVVSLAEWVEELEHIRNPSPQDLAKRPALKLLSFYQALARNAGAPNAEISVENSKKASRTMASLGPVSLAQMSNWLNQWDF
nr:carboxylic acid reductase [Expression vector JGI_C3]